MKKTIATVVTAGLLVVGGAGAAYAADDPGSNGQNPPATAQGRVRARPALRLKLRRAVVKVSADTIGIDVKDLRTTLRGGQSIAQVAGSKGVEVQKVIDAIVAAADKKIDELAAAGTIKAERATKLKERVPQAAERAVNHVPGQKAAANAS